MRKRKGYKSQEVKFKNKQIEKTAYLWTSTVEKQGPSTEGYYASDTQENNHAIFQNSYFISNYSKPSSFRPDKF